MGFRIENGVLKDYTEEPSVTEITIPDGVTEIKNGAFMSCESLTSITLPESVREIGDFAFAYCKNLTTVKT